MAAAAFPSFSVTGPVHHFVAWREIAATPVYLGTCESGPSVAFRELSADWASRESGSQLPMQRIEGGQMASIALGLNRFSKSTWLALQTAVSPARASAWSRGRPVFGTNTVQLWMLFENYIDAATRAKFPGLEIGWYWPQVQMLGKEYPRIGNGQDTLLVVSAEAHPFYVPPANPRAFINGEREWKLYSSDPADFPAGVQVPQ